MVRSHGQGRLMMKVGGFWWVCARRMNLGVHCERFSARKGLSEVVSGANDIQWKMENCMALSSRCFKAIVKLSR
jgi:hypothetical protein